jgi:predicted O-methyltransferase YrrM
MTPGGTTLHQFAQELPPLVTRALELALRLSFEFSCRPEQGRLLQLLAAGKAGGLIGETGTGCGVGLAWMLSGAGPGTRIFSVERDGQRAQAVREMFADQTQVTVLHDDWTGLLTHGPFDLLVLDGGGQGKRGTEPADPQVLLRPGGTVVLDDLTPARHWPPRFNGQVDEARMYWLDHPGLDASELKLAPDLAALVATRRFAP